VRKFVLEGYSNDKWITIKEGTSVGSKRIEEFPAIRLSKVRLRITDAIATPLIQNLAFFNIEQSRQNTNDNSKNTSVTLGGWDNKTFSTEWQDFRLDLTPYLVEKVGQFELKFQTITHDRNFEKATSGGYGPELKDWKIDMDGAVNPDAIKKTGNGIFLINNSQHISKESTSKVIFSTQIRTKPGRSVGSIELKMLGFE
jgi:alpha-L-fucosidase